jgi:hypothetical protein
MTVQRMKKANLTITPAKNTAATDSKIQPVRSACGHGV